MFAIEIGLYLLDLVAYNNVIDRNPKASTKNPPSEPPKKFPKYQDADQFAENDIDHVAFRLIFFRYTYYFPPATTRYVLMSLAKPCLRAELLARLKVDTNV